MALFDTDVLIDHLRGNKGALETLLKFKLEPNYYSVITLGEILFGMKKSEEKITFLLMDTMTPLPVDRDIILLSYDIKTSCKGHNLNIYDCVIAATAVRLGLTLVTRNAKHYIDKRIKIFIPDY